MQTDLHQDQAGAAICGRLKGPAFQYAMSLRLDRLDPVMGVRRMVEAPELFAEPAHAEV